MNTDESGDTFSSAHSAWIICVRVCLVYSPVGHGQGPGTGSTVQGVPDLGLLAGGACFDREKASGRTLVVQNGRLDWIERDREEVVVRKQRLQCCHDLLMLARTALLAFLSEQLM